METVLIVDDDPEQLASLRSVLEAEGYRVLIAYDGDAGFARATRHVPDLIITDWGMPTMDGKEMSRRLQSHTALAHVPVLMLSGTDTDPSAVFANFFRKPCNLDVLLQIADGLLADVRRLKRMRPVPQLSRWSGIDTRCWP